MADSIRVIKEDWEDIQDKINEKVEAIKTTLDEFKAILDDLATNGFIENGAHDPIVSFKGNVEDIRDCLDYIYQNISTIIRDYVAEVEATDHNSLQT